MTEDDLSAGVELLCIRGDGDLIYLGETYRLTMVHQELSMWPYVIGLPDGKTVVYSFKELTGEERREVDVKFILPSEITDEELFLVKMAGKIPKRFV